MKDQINTIREALTLSTDGPIIGRDDMVQEALAALAQLEAMVGEQEPVAWLVCSVNSDGSLSLEYAAAWKEGAHEHINDAITEHGVEEAASWVVRPAYVAAPVAQQPQAEPDDEILKERDDAEDFIDMLLDEVLGTDRPEWTSAYGRDDALRDVQERMTALHKPTVDKAWDRFEKAQQPQARPDFTDEWTGYLKDGETPFERFLRERKDLQSMLKLYQRVLEENERLKAQQPQAETDNHEARGQIEFLDKKNNALLAAIRKVMARLADLLDEDQFKEIEETISSAGVQPQAEAVPQAAEFCWLVEYFDGDGTGNSTGHYYTGKIGIADRVLTTMDANEAKRYDTWREANLASVKLGSTLTGTWRAVQHGFHTIPQQAEAVPPTHVLVPVDEPTDEMVDAACAAVDGLCRVDFVRAYVAAFAHLKAGYRDESYWCGWNAAIKFQQADAVPIGVVVAIDASDPENGPDAIVALHRDVALGAKLYDRPPSQGAEIAELKDLLRISVENCESQRKKAERATATIYDIHYALKDAGWHPGRTDDKLTDIIRAKGERMRELEAEPGIRLTPEEIEALRHTMSSAVLFSRAKNISDIRSSVLTRFDQFFEHVKDHVRPHRPDPEAVAEGLAQIIFEAINPGKVWMYQSTDTRNAYWQAGQAAKEFLK